MLTLLYRHIPSASPLPLFRCNIRHFAPCLAPYRNDMSTTMVNNNLTHWIDFRSTYSGHNDLGIKGLQTTILYESKCLRRCVNISIVMWTQHSIQNLLMLNQFTRSNNIPNEKTMMCACWREPGCTTDFKTSHDFWSGTEMGRERWGPTDLSSTLLKQQIGVRFAVLLKEQ